MILMPMADVWMKVVRHGRGVRGGAVCASLNTGGAGNHTSGTQSLIGSRVGPSLSGGDAPGRWSYQVSQADSRKECALRGG